ncbi:hypothetical protein ABLE92_04560 [Gordonia sp. VNQ95]|uniref:hypothetical protein n=1 Tax=Gordonia sp. VNQ95 TaxID=3156619 RepID=UPI0032B3E45E
MRPPPADPVHGDTPHVRTGPSRRTVLRGGVMLGVGVTVVATAAGCDRGPTPGQVTAQALVPLARSALADAAAARALAPQVTDYAAALGVVADQRGQHAQALREEITRLDQDIAGQIDTVSGGASSTSASSSGAGPSATSGPAAPSATTLDGLRSALAASAKAARSSAIDLSGYSSGLTGSISASVTTLMEVQLG